MAELIGCGENVLKKINDGWYVLLPKTENNPTFWKLICNTDDPLWAPKCIAEIDKHY